MNKLNIGLILWILFESALANPEQEAKALAESLQQKPSLDQQKMLEELRQSSDKKIEAEVDGLQSLFNIEGDVGKKGEDPLKSSLGKKQLESAQKSHPNLPSLSEAEGLLKQKHRFKIADTDPIFNKAQEISKTELGDKESIFQINQPSALPEAKEKIVTCRQSVKPELKNCVKRLVLTATPQPPIVKDVTAYFVKQCYNLVSFGINLKTGAISVSQCTNAGPQNIYVTNPIGEPPLPNQTTIQLLSRQHFGEGGVDFRTNQMNPCAANGFTASFTAFQPKTGHKQKGNRDHSRGGKYVWRVTLPQLPILSERWEGCEDLEARTLEGSCEQVETELKELDETRTILGYPSPVSRPHWSEHHAFICGSFPEINECEGWLEQGCEQIDSKCVSLKNGVCIEFENTFKCGVSGYLKGDSLSFDPDLNAFSKTKAESTISYEAEDFGQAATHLSALTEIGKKLQDELGGVSGNSDNPTVFHGKCQQCRVNLGSFFRDCCRLKGILQGLLGGCNDEERKLAIAAIRNKRCVKVEGRYCHKKTLGVCVEKRDSYCCYGSQLARIIQEIAHQQLGLAWGDAEHPNCEGLTSEQLSRLNFDTPYAQSKLKAMLPEIQASAQEKFERVQQAVGSANIQEQVDALEKRQKAALEKAKEGIK